MGTLQCVDPVSCITSHCLCNAVSRETGGWERDTALHKQRDVIQLTGSTHCSSIPFILYKDKEDKTHISVYIPQSCIEHHNVQQW